MLALSIKQPWSELIVMGKKSIEVRTWLPEKSQRFAEGQTIAIHASKKYGEDAPIMLEYEACYSAPRGAGQGFAPVTASERCGGIIGAAKLVESFRFEDKQQWIAAANQHLNPPEWWDDGTGLCGWVFAHAVRFEEIIPCSGQLRLFALYHEIVEQVQERMRQ